MSYNARYINAETEEIADFISDSANQRERYIVRPLSPEHFNMLKAKLPFTNLSKATLDDLNSLVPRDAFGNKEVAFIRFNDQFNDQKYKNIGLVALGQFHSNDNYEAIAPDSLDLYLAKKDSEGKVRLWRSLKTTPGFENVYRFGKSPFVTKQMIVPGASRDHRGSMAVDTSSYEVIQATRNFFNKAIEVSNSKEYRILHGILNDDYSVMDTKPIYKRSDTWSVKNNELANGKLENILFTSSQIHDADFLKPKTSMGEQYMVSKKLNNEVFEMASSGFRRGASRNRINFIKDLNKNRDTIYKVEDGKPLDELKALKDRFISFNTNEFRDKLKVFGQLEEVFGNEEIKENSFLENFRKKKFLTGANIKTLLGDDKFDYLFKRENFMKELYKIVNEANEEKKVKNKYSYPENFDKHSFNKTELKKLIDKYNEEYKEIEKELVKEMKERISSKIDASFDRRYYSYMNDVKKEDKKKMLKAIEMDMIRDFYDKYNEKIDLYEIMVKNRRNSVISEAEAVADRVRFEYSKDGKTIIGVKPITDKAFDYITDLSKDVGLRWGYYKARIDIGASKFDKMTLGNRLNHARKYLDKNQSYRDLFKKVSEKSMFGKYDTYDNFKTAQTGEFKYNFLDDAVVARTNDKIIARLNTDNSLSVNGAMRYGDKIFRINLNLNGYDGFNKNDYIKELSSQMQASMKEMDLSTQKFIESQAKTGRKVYKLYKLIDKAQASLKGKDDDEYKKLNKMKSFLLGQKDRTKSSYGAIWGLKNGELVYLKDGPRDKKGRLLHQDGVTNLESYNEIYDNIIDYMKSKYNKEVGYALYDTYRMRYGKEKEDMNSLSELNYEIVRKFGHQIDNTVFTAILNNDQLINTTGASKQSSLIHGNTYLGHLGVAQPGLAWNKVTQRTFQAQDILGEQYVEINGKKKTVSEINSEIISRLNLSGVGKRHGRYVTDELYKGAVNRMNKQYGLNNSDYRRGEVYKTFAIGDVNSTIRDSGINTFSLSFQEGMTAAKSMVLTTNAIRNKEFTLNIDEFNLDNLNISKKDLHKKLLTQEGLDEVLSMVINENLYGTIAGRKKYAEMLTKLSNPDILRKIDIEDKDSYKGASSYYEAMANIIGFTPKKFDDYTDNSSKRMAITKEIYKHLENLRDVTGAVALPTTSQGKNVITNENYIRTKNELKPEYGFSISDYRYNAQTRNIELMLENIGLSTQGTKGQTNGAKFTISEIYDFLKVRANNKDQFIDAVFNNKAEKREQTGMIVHTALQTVFSHVYDTAKLEGVSRLKENMKELLKDMNVNIIIDEQRNTYRIDERYLTVNPETNNIMTIEEFQKYMREPTENLSKLFNDKGRVILDNLIKKYSSQYNDGDTIQKQGAHIGILNAMTQAYTQTFKDMGKTEIPFMIKNATVSGIANDTETQFGDGNFWLLRLSSERVNSNASKKKESGLKIGREMAQRQIAAGYRELVDFTERRNKKRLSSFLGDVFNGMSNAELLQQVYSHKKDFSLEQLNLSMSETLRNGIFFNLDELKDDDYLFNDKEIYLTHTKFMADSLLGKAITDKNLGGLKDGKLEKDINVVVHDKDINAFTESLKKSIKNVRGYFEDRVDNSTEIIKNYQGDDIDKLKQSLEYDKKTVEFFNNLELLNFTDIRKTEKQITSILDKNLTNKNIVEKLSGQDLYRTKEFLGLVRRNLKDTYSLDQLRTIMKTGNILTTVNLEYDVDDVTNQIVASKSFNKLRNIARKYYDLNKASHAEKLFMDKMDNKDKTLVDDIYSSMVDYYSNKTDLQSFSVFGDLFNSLNFGEKTKLSELQNTTKKILDSEHMLRAEIDATNNFFQEYYNKLGLTEDQFRTQLDKAHEHVKSVDDGISKDKENVLEKLKDSEIQSAIKSKLSKTLFENEKLRNNKKMASFYEDKIRDHFSNSFDLLNEYISVPANSEGLFQKKGSITDKQKFRVNSSFVANPLEGSNLLNKFEGLLFNARDHKELTKNFKEFQEFLGADVVNDRLFTDSEGVNWLDKLGDIKDNRAYKKGLETAREVFSKNLSNISEVTITDKRYMSAFRTDKADWTDDFTGESISKKGYVRELGFLSRHPQQTINHMGAVTNITLDTDHDIKNKFARAVLTYLPKEKNNAAVITLGKKTMLYRRGD